MLRRSQARTDAAGPAGAKGMRTAVQLPDALGEELLCLGVGGRHGKIDFARALHQHRRLPRTFVERLAIGGMTGQRFVVGTGGNRLLGMGWKPKTSLEEGLRQTFAWFTDNVAKT